MVGKDVEPVVEMDVTELIQHLNSKDVESLKSVGGKTIKGKLKDNTQFTTVLPEEMRYTFYSDYLKPLVDKKEIRYRGEEEPGTPWFVEALPTIFLILVFV